MNMEGIALVIVTILFVAAITLLLTLYSRRQLAREWSGRVEKLLHYTRADNRQGNSIATQTHYICMLCRKEDGRKIKVKMDKATFEKWYADGLQVGDIVHKKAGGWYPVRLPDTRKEVSL